MISLIFVHQILKFVARNVCFEAGTGVLRTAWMKGRMRIVSYLRSAIRYRTVGQCGSAPRAVIDRRQRAGVDGHQNGLVDLLSRQDQIS